MGFARPEFLWLLTLLPPLAIWTILGRWRRRKRWQSLAQRGRPSRDGTPGIVASIVCLILALAQPRWGRLPGSALPPGHDLVLVIDVSRSMATEDAVPSRLSVAVEMARSLVRPLGRDPSNRAAVVAFAGRGVLRCPLTENLGAVLAALGRLRPGSVNPGGTDLGAALDAAIDALAVDREEHAQGRAIAIFSDGEDHADRWRTRIKRLRQQDIVVHTIAIGDAVNGHPVPIDNRDQPLTFQGETVLSKRSDASLEAIAHGTDGTIVKLGLASGDLGELYESKIEPLARRQREAARLAGMAERFPLFLLSALVFLLLGCLPANRGWHWHLGWRGSLGWRRAARALGRASMLISLAVLTAGAANSQPKAAVDSARSALARGMQAYEDGRLDQALQAFETAIDRAPHLAVPRYNAAATLFQLKEYARARERYQEARLTAGAVLRTKIDYALGNTLLALGEITAAIHAYDECLASTASGEQVEQVRRDAAVNRKFAVEHAESPAIADSENPDGPSRLPRRGGRRGSDPRQDVDDTSPDAQPDSGAGANPEGGDQDERDRPPNRTRRTGGAGGTGKGQDGYQGGTPDERLNAALEHIREAAESRRLPEELPPDKPVADGKDW
jgi:Ca-activated chloride channel family protein